MATKTTKRYSTHVTTPDGRRVYVSGKTKAERDKKAAQVRKEIDLGYEVGDRTTFAEFTETWVGAYKAPRLRESSLAILRNNLRGHILPVLGHMQLRDIRPLHVHRFIASLAGLSKSVQSKCLSIVKEILQAAANNGLISTVPFDKNDKAGGAETEEKEPLTKEQAARLLDVVSNTRAYGFCLIALSTGMRRGEILGLMWEDIDWHSNVINVTHNKAFISGENDAEVTCDLKTKAAQRRLPIAPALRVWLENERLCSDSPYVVSMEDGNSLTHSSVSSMWRLVRRRLAKAGCDFDAHPHLLRHTFATQLFEAGMDIKQVQYLLGHSSPEMTLRVYTHYNRRSREEETADKLCQALTFLAG